MPTGASDDSGWQQAMVCELFGADPATPAGKRPLQGSITQSLSFDCSDQAYAKNKSAFFALYNQLSEVSAAIATLNTTVNPANAAPITKDQSILDNVGMLVDTKTNYVDATRTDLYGYGTRLVGLLTNPPGRASSVGVIPSVSATKTQIPSVIYNVNALNLVLTPQATTDNTKKKLIVAITVVYGDSRWEASAGTFFSSLPIRSFTANPVFATGSPDTVTDKKVAENDLRPLVIPFAAMNYRISDDLKRPTWRENLYWTGAVGINPNTVTTDFATGLSFAYRLSMVSALWHVGHDVGLTQGVKVGDSLGPSFSGSLPTETNWSFTNYAIGISVRIPALTGR